jgi:hypothetical protein
MDRERWGALIVREVPESPTTLAFCRALQTAMLLVVIPRTPDVITDASATTSTGWSIPARCLPTR